jgi:hypothetical protein
VSRFDVAAAGSTAVVDTVASRIGGVIVAMARAAVTTTGVLNGRLMVGNVPHFSNEVFILATSRWAIAGTTVLRSNRCLAATARHSRFLFLHLERGSYCYSCVDGSEYSL